MTISSSPSNTKISGRIQDFFFGASILFLGIQLIAWTFFLPQALRGHTSFRQLYTAGYLVRTGHADHLYDYNVQKRFQDELISREPMLMPFIRPPFDALVFVPFSLLPYGWAYVTFVIFDSILLVFSVRMLQSWTSNLRTTHKWLPIMIFFSFVPVAVALILGQDSILLLALLSTSTLALEKGRDFQAGAIAGCGLFKFHLLIPLALLLLAWKRFRFFAGFTVVAAALGVVSLMIVPPSQLHLYANSLLTIGKGTNGTQELLRYPLPVTMMANVRGLTVGILGHLLASPTQTVVTAALALAILAAVAIAVPSQCSQHRAMAIAITASVSASYYLFVYDLTILLLPLLIVLNQAGRISGEKVEFSVWLSTVLLYLAPACFFFSISHFFLVSLAVFFLLFVLIKSAQNEKRELVAV